VPSIAAPVAKDLRNQRRCHVDPRDLGKTEAGFAKLSSEEAMRYLGALIGLSIGYFVTLHLDYRFVFWDSP
jgi:hypothetical protein